MPVFIDHRICDREDICDLVKVCPREAIVHNRGEGTISVDHSKCNECLLCLKACPYLAVKLAKDADELGEFERKASRIKLNKSAHLARIYSMKPGRIGRAGLNDSNFKKKVGAKIPTLVSFWGAHSRVIAPLLKGVGKRHGKKLRVANIKVADNPKTRRKYRITTTPTLVLFRSGREIGRLEGIRHRETLRVWLEMKLNAL